MFKKTILALLGAVALCSHQTTAQNFTAGDVIEMFAGVMNGIVHEDHLNYLLGCMNGTEAIVTDVEDAVQEFSQGTFWSITEGILDIKQLIVDIPFTITNCGDIPQDFEKLGNFFSIFGNMTLLTQRVTYNLIWYYSDIMMDVNAALAFYGNEDYFNFGDKLGDALVLACGDHSSEVKPVNSFVGNLESLQSRKDHRGRRNGNKTESKDHHWNKTDQNSSEGHQYWNRTDCNESRRNGSEGHHSNKTEYNGKHWNKTQRNSSEKSRKWNKTERNGKHQNKSRRNGSEGRRNWNKTSRNGSEGRRHWNKTERNGQHQNKTRRNETQRNETRRNGSEGHHWNKSEHNGSNQWNNTEHNKQGNHWNKKNHSNQAHHKGKEGRGQKWNKTANVDNHVVPPQF